jgi:hypothetical protein
LKLEEIELHSNFAFKFNLRRYIMALDEDKKGHSGGLSARGVVHFGGSV